MSRSALGGIAALLVLSAGAARAESVEPFSLSALQNAQAAGRPVLVDAHADWCPTCRAQAPTISAISRDPRFARLVILRLNYDTQVAEKRDLDISHQSTLIAFKGRKEVGRSVGVTDPAQIRLLAESTLR
jgi:thiol-disulfide isomerase/thioredoxin